MQTIVVPLVSLLLSHYWSRSATFTPKYTKDVSIGECSETYRYESQMSSYRHITQGIKLHICLPDLRKGFYKTDFFLFCFSLIFDLVHLCPTSAFLFKASTFTFNGNLEHLGLTKLIFKDVSLELFTKMILFS